MRRRQRSSEVRLRLSLLAAAVLYLFGAVAEPVMHAYATGPAEVEHVRVSSGTEPSAPAAPEAEAGCVFCLAASSAALPVADAAPAEPAPGAIPITPGVLYLDGARPFLCPTPRGPPLT
jgi:hypothetical protein